MTKIILGQVSTIAGNVEQNYNKIKDCINHAVRCGAKLVIFPEYALCGYPLGDICGRYKNIYDTQMEVLKELSLLSETTNIIIGGIDEQSKSKTFLLSKCKIYENPKYIVIDNEKFIIVSGEYDTHFTINGSADGIIHLSASSSQNGKEFLKNKYLSDVARKNNWTYIYVNKTGYCDNLVFDGISRVYDKSGMLTARAGAFKEEYTEVNDYKAVINTIPMGMNQPLNDNFSLNYEKDLARMYKSVIFAIREYFKTCGFSKAVLGLSGGLDSTVCAVLLADALGAENVYGISMPTKISSEAGKNDAKLLASNLGIHYFEKPIENFIKIFSDDFIKLFSDINAEQYSYSTTFENLQARTRAIILWSIANQFKGMLPVATSDKSEAYIGYATVNGDMSGGFAPVADITKTKLFALGDYMNKNRSIKNVIPENILKKPPGAELKIDKKTGKTVTAEEDNMPYPFLDEIIWAVENENASHSDLMNRQFLYENMYNITDSDKKLWIDKFYRKMNAAIFKWHLLPPTVAVEQNSIIYPKYYHPILSKIK